MLAALMLVLAALGIALLRLWSYRRQVMELARQVDGADGRASLGTDRGAGAADHQPAVLDD